MSFDIWTSDAVVSHRLSMEEIPEAYRLVWNRNLALLDGLIDWR